MATWSRFVEADPLLATELRALIQQYGPGLGYLATVRPDGGPRLHPVSPVIADGGLFCLILDSPKRRDLAGDGRYALHTFPAESTDDEGYLTGRTCRVTEANRLALVARATRATPAVDWWLFELFIEVAMVIRRRVPADGDTPIPAVEPTMRRIWRSASTRPDTQAATHVRETCDLG